MAHNNKFINQNERCKCVLCGKEFFGIGNNPAPLSQHGECCDDCNLNKVVPARLGLFE